MGQIPECTSQLNFTAVFSPLCYIQMNLRRVLREMITSEDVLSLNSPSCSGEFSAVVPVEFGLNLSRMPLWMNVNDPEAGIALVNVLLVA